MRPSTTLALATCGVPPKVVQRIEAEIGAVTAERDAYRTALEDLLDRHDRGFSLHMDETIEVLARFAPATEEDQ